ncbi:MAG: helix-turn-helix domain-containing protein [Opitutales bacterium]|jgi:excisionase family DNA binding protein
MPTVEQLLTLRQVASCLSLSTRAVYRLIADGALPRPVKLGGASRFYESDVHAFLEKLRAQRG